VIITKLQKETKRDEDACDEIWTSFSTGEIEHQEFVKSFIEKRKTQHRRAAKLEMVQIDPSILSRAG